MIHVNFTCSGYDRVVGLGRVEVDRTKIHADVGLGSSLCPRPLLIGPLVNFDEARCVFAVGVAHGGL